MAISAEEETALLATESGDHFDEEKMTDDPIELEDRDGE